VAFLQEKPELARALVELEPSYGQRVARLMAFGDAQRALQVAEEAKDGVSLCVLGSVVRF
jgi:hypothetical protein